MLLEVLLYCIIVIFQDFTNQILKQTLDSVGEDWPISYKDLEKYYKANEKLMNVRGLDGDPVYPDINHLKSNIPLGQVVNKNCKRI